MHTLSCSLQRLQFKDMHFLVFTFLCSCTALCPLGYLLFQTDASQLHCNKNLQLLDLLTIAPCILGFYNCRLLCGLTLDSVWLHVNLVTRLSKSVSSKLLLTFFLLCVYNLYNKSEMVFTFQSLNTVFLMLL